MCCRSRSPSKPCGAGVHACGGSSRPACLFAPLSPCQLREGALDPLGGQFVHRAPHAFLPKVGKPVPDNWEIAFIAITPRNLKEDTQAVSDDVRAAYRRVVGVEAPLGA